MSRPVVGPQSSVNERLVALEIVRQVLVLRFSLRVRQLIVDAINKTEVPVARMIRDALHTDAGLRDPGQLRELERLIDQLNAIRQPAWQAGRLAAEDELKALADAEPEDQRDLFAFLLPGVELLLPSVVGGLGAAALITPFQGRTFKRWLDDAEEAEQKRVRQAVVTGAALGETPATVARRVVGTAPAQGRDGATQLSRNHIDTVVRSATIHFGAYARDQFYQANALTRYTPPPPGTPRPPVRPVGEPEDPMQAEAVRQAQQARAAADRAAGGAGKGGSKLFLLEQYVAVLDNRTTKLCRGLDGNRYRLGEGPIPPLHMNCRSNRVVVLPDAVGGPLYDPGQYGAWVRSQPFEVQALLMGSTRARKLTDEELADTAFEDYGARPMTLGQIRDEARRIMEFY